MSTRQLTSVKPKSFLSAALLSCLCVFLVLYREDACLGAAEGIRTCLNGLIPSLFPFVLLSCLFTHGRGTALLFRPFAPLMRRLFRLPACAAPAVFLGLTAGYPAGAKITAGLCAEGRLTQAQAARLLCFCTAPGYAFSLYAGTQLTGSTKTGLLLFLSCTFSSLLTGMLFARFAPLPQPNRCEAPPVGSFADAVRDSVSAMVSLCAYVVIFSALLSALRRIGFISAAAVGLSRVGVPREFAEALLYFLFEVTAGTVACAGSRLSPITAAFGLGFSGVCIGMQIISFFRSTPFPMSVAKYFLIRLLGGVFSAACCRILLCFFPAAQPAAAITGTLQPAPSAVGTSAAGALLLLSVFFLFSCIQNTAGEK